MVTRDRAPEAPIAVGDSRTSIAPNEEMSLTVWDAARSNWWKSLQRLWRQQSTREAMERNQPFLRLTCGEGKKEMGI